MKKVPYDVIQKEKKVTKKLHKVFEQFKLFFCASKEAEKYSYYFI